MVILSGPGVLFLDLLIALLSSAEVNSSMGLSLLIEKSIGRPSGMHALPKKAPKALACAKGEIIGVSPQVIDLLATWVGTSRFRKDLRMRKAVGKDPVLAHRLFQKSLLSCLVSFLSLAETSFAWSHIGLTMDLFACLSSLRLKPRR